MKTANEPIHRPYNFQVGRQFSQALFTKVDHVAHVLDVRPPSRLWFCPSHQCTLLRNLGVYNHSRVFLWVFLWVARILEAVLKRPLQLAWSSYDADVERTKNALDSLRGFVDERYHDGCGIRVFPFAKIFRFPFLPRRRASSLSMNVTVYPFFSSVHLQRPALRSARCYRRRRRVLLTKER